MNTEFYTKYSDWLIPVLCVLVIFQTAMLLSDEARQKIALVAQNVLLVGSQVKSTPTTEPVAAQIQLVPQTVKAIKGKPAVVEVWLKPNKPVNLGGMDLVLKFDPQMAGVTKIEPQKVFSLVLPNRQSEKSGRLFVTYLDESGKGVLIGQGVKLLILTLTPKQAGILKLSLVSSTEGATTVLAEKTSSKSLPFVSNDLLITVSEK